MKCPSCGYEDSKVVDSRAADEGAAIRRRRECLECGYRFTTYERMGDNPLVVIKADGSSEVYERDKLFKGVLIACAKRPVQATEIGALIDSIESELRLRSGNEVRSKELGEMVLERLAEIDDVAYIRFASVYRDFKNVDEFMQSLEEMK